MCGTERIIHIYKVWKHLGENEYKQYNSEVQMSFEELENKIKETHTDFQFGENKNIEIIDHTESGRVKTIKIGNINLAGTEIRSILGLKSTNFTIQIENNIVKFIVIGYGHGVRNESNWSRDTCQIRI